MSKKLTPMSELITDLDIMEEEANKLGNKEGKALWLVFGRIKKHIIDGKFLENERIEIERGVKSGLSGLPASALSYYENRFINEKDV